MKKFLALVLLLMSLGCYAQTDSTTIKLNQYKAWKEAGVISDEDYESLKAALLHLPTENKTQTQTAATVDSATLESYRTKGKSNITGGAVIMGLGGAVLVGTITYAAVAKGPNDISRKTAIGAGIAVGSVALIIGAVLTGIGIHNKVLYKENKKQLSVIAERDRVGLAFEF